MEVLLSLPYQLGLMCQLQEGALGSFWEHEWCCREVCGEGGAMGRLRESWAEDAVTLGAGCCHGAVPHSYLACIHHWNLDFQSLG